MVVVLLDSQPLTAVPAVRAIKRGSVKGKWQGQTINAAIPATHPRIVCHMIMPLYFGIMLLAVCQCNDDRHKSKKHSSRQTMAEIWYHNWYTYEKPVNNRAEYPFLQQNDSLGRLNLYELQFQFPFRFSFLNYFDNNVRFYFCQSPVNKIHRLIQKVR